MCPAGSRPTVTEDSRQLSSLVIGLGGGGLPLFMSSYAGLQTTVVELDEQVSRLAADYFGCHANPGLQVIPLMRGCADCPHSKGRKLGKYVSCRSSCALIDARFWVSLDMACDPATSAGSI